MAERESPETEPKLDSSQADDRDREIRTMDVRGFNSAIRFVKRGRIEPVEQVLVVANQHVERLSIEVDEDDVVVGTPDGSDQIDVRSIYDWMERIQPGDKKAKRQLAAIAATLRYRISH